MICRLGSRSRSTRAASPEVAVLHTQVVGSSESEIHDRYAPSELSTLVGLGYDYWALGHVHRRQILARAPWICYPGTPQGLSIREPGGRGILLVDLSERTRAGIQFIEQARGPVGIPRDLRPRGRRKPGGARCVRSSASGGPGGRRMWGSPGCDFIVRVDLRGQTPLAAELLRPDGIQTMEAELKGALGALDVEVLAARGLVQPVAWKEHRDRPDVLGEALRLAEAIRSDPSAIPLAPDELAALHRTSDPEQLEEYVRSLLDGAEAEIASRLLSDPAAP